MAKKKNVLKDAVVVNVGFGSLGGAMAMIRHAQAQLAARKPARTRKTAKGGGKSK